MLCLGCETTAVQPVCESDLRWLDDPSSGSAHLEDCGQPLLDYRYRARDGSEPWRVNYVHPLFAVDGVPLTEDRPDDHPHQRGIFWAWRRILIDGVQVADGWVGTNFRIEVRPPVLATDAGIATLSTEAVWSVASKDGFESLVLENTEISVHRLQEGSRRIEFVTRLRPSRSGVSIGGTDDEKGYGGYSLRLRDGARLRISTGGRELEARVESMATEAAVEFAWQDGDPPLRHRLRVECTVDGAPWRSWVLRQEASMQNCAFPGRVPVALSEARPLVLRASLLLQ